MNAITPLGHVLVGLHSINPHISLQVIRELPNKYTCAFPVKTGLRKRERIYVAVHVVYVYVKKCN